MSCETIIIKGVNCSKTRWLYRGIGTLVCVGWLTRLIVALLATSSWSSTLKDESSALGICSVPPFSYIAFKVVSSFYVPVPTPRPKPTHHNSGATRHYFPYAVGFMMIMMCSTCSYFRMIEFCICNFMIFAGYLAVFQLSTPLKSVYIQHVVHAYLMLCLVGYLSYQLPVWTAYGLAALLLLNTFLLKGMFPEEEEEENDKSPV
ncbi:hypothetical protein HID58_050739 [Brassica napus]|uniref:Uncharacterized protein n=1 Tax=Brassica napus TaxID=3708 RepID=A0ABQ8A8D6_BRANA|nr:hypothetical protein HID58_050739 [Brassica napus]